MTTELLLRTEYGLWHRQQRLLSRMQLHVDGNEQRRGAGIVAHQHHQLDELVRPEQRLRLGEGFRRHLVVMKNLAAELDNRGVGFVEACGGLAVLDHLDDACLDPCLERLGLVRCPFELAVHLARGCQDGDLAYARRKSRFEAQVPVERTRVLGRLRAVEPRSEEHTSELQSQSNLVCRLLLEKKKLSFLREVLRPTTAGGHALPGHHRISLPDSTSRVIKLCNHARLLQWDTYCYM